jgi:processive 1,2-diacylglycerol beta-glucosyltransferase
MTDAGVLIVSASTGTGHARAAEAIRAAFGEQEPALQAEHIDLLELAPGWVRRAYGDGFELLARRAPRVWGEVYRRTDAEAADLARWGPIAQRILFREFRRLLLSRRWGACVCTHFLPGQLAAGGAGLPPFSMVITDLTLHRFWAQPRVGRFFVAGAGLARELHARLPAAEVLETGIPVAPTFREPLTRCDARASLGLEGELPLVLVMGGGLGIGVEESARACAAASGVRVVAVCGRNEEAAARLRRDWSGDPNRHALGYVRDIHRYVAAADLVLTKPGGLTTAEVLAIGRPLLLAGAIPGQEEGNARVLVAAGAALNAARSSAIGDLVIHALSDRECLPRMEAAARALGRPDAAARIAASVASSLPLPVAA